MLSKITFNKYRLNWFSRRVNMWCFLLNVAVILLIAGCQRAGKSSVEIGAILPLTGDAAIYGQELKNGIELAREEINNSGGIKGKKIEVKYEDDRGQPKEGVSAIQKLISADKVPVIIGGATSSVALAIAPIAVEKKVVLLSPTATAPALSKVGKYFFLIWPSDNYDGLIMAQFAFDKLGLKKVAILYVNTEYGQGIDNVFKKEFEKRGGQILISESYELGASDFRTQLTKMKQLEPDAIYLPGYYKELAGILRQARELGVKSVFLSVNSFYDPKLLEIAGNSAEGAIFTYPTYDAKSEEPLTKKFVEVFKAKYKKEPDAFAVQGYDAMKTVADAIQAGGDSSESIRDAMAHMKDFPGVGGSITFDVNGDVRKPLRFLTVQGGQFVPLQK